MALVEFPEVIGVPFSEGASLDGQRSTIEEYNLLPEERGRYELIDGVLSEMAPPNDHHGLIIEHLSTCILARTARKSNIRVKQNSAIQTDSSSVLIPDLVVTAKNDRVVLVVEVTSGGWSNRNRDLYTKVTKYKNSAAPEYWIVDQQEKQIIRYRGKKWKRTEHKSGTLFEHYLIGRIPVNTVLNPPSEPNYPIRELTNSRKRVRKKVQKLRAQLIENGISPVCSSPSSSPPRKKRSSKRAQ